jgi:hypothetical protein
MAERQSIIRVLLFRKDMSMTQTVTIVNEGPGYQILDPGRQIDLSVYLGEETLRSALGFSAKELYEDLHWEQSYEFIIPQNGPVELRISDHSCEYDDKGRAVNGDLTDFRMLRIEVGQMLVIFPRYCHRVTKKERFIALKVNGYFKLCAKPPGVSDREAKGRCPHRLCTLWEECERIYTSRSADRQGLG